MGEKKEIQCPWCKVLTVPLSKRIDVRDGSAVAIERRCSHCKKVLASYLEGEGNFLPKIRVLKN